MPLLWLGLPILMLALIHQQWVPLLFPAMDTVALPCTAYACTPMELAKIVLSKPSKQRAFLSSALPLVARLYDEAVLPICRNKHSAVSSSAYSSCPNNPNQKI